MLRRSAFALNLPKALLNDLGNGEDAGRIAFPEFEKAQEQERGLVAGVGHFSLTWRRYMMRIGSSAGSVSA